MVERGREISLEQRTRLREPPRCRNRHHQPDGVLRLFPHRDGVRQLGEDRRRFRSGRVAARAPGRWLRISLGITELDPLAYDLLFERLLNPERVSMPDFDIDFCMIGTRCGDRARCRTLRPRRRSVRSSTFGTMAAKAVVRDVARVQGKPYGLADKLSKLIPFEVGMTLERAVAEAPELRDFIADNEEVGEIMDMAYKLEGIVRNVGKHAGGVVIAPSKLTDFVPLYVDDASAGVVSQFDKDDVERAGLVKFDFLGLKTLTIIDWAVAAINEARGRRAAKRSTSSDIPLDDPRVFELLERRNKRPRCSSSNPAACRACWSRRSPTGSKTSSRSARCSGPARWN